MRRIILGLLATAALAAPIALASSADAATNGSGTGSMHFVTHYQGVDYVHDGTTAYTCDGAGNVNFTFQGADEGWTGHGTGVITSTVVTIHGSRLTDGYSYDITGNVTGPNAWALTASTDSLGQVGASAEGTFTGVPDCSVDPVVPVGNHGQYVSGATKAGVKGKDLAAIAKDVTLVGPYTG